MSDFSAVKISVIGLELNIEGDESKIICDFYTGERLVDSFFLGDDRVSYTCDFSDDFQFVRIVVRMIHEREPIGETLLTFSFLNECEVD